MYSNSVGSSHLSGSFGGSLNQHGWVAVLNGGLREQENGSVAESLLEVQSFGGQPRIGSSRIMWHRLSIYRSSEFHIHNIDMHIVSCLSSICRSLCSLLYAREPKMVGQKSQPGAAVLQPLIDS